MYFEPSLCTVYRIHYITTADQYSYSHTSKRRPTDDKNFLNFFFIGEESKKKDDCEL